MATPIDERFDVALYSVAEAARHLDVKRQTFDTWVRGYERRPKDRARAHRGAPIVTALHAAQGEPRIPFIGLAEGFVLRAFRDAGVPLQRVRPAVDALEREFGIAHVLASESLYTDGAEVLYNFAENEGDTPEGRAVRELVAPRTGQRVFVEVVQSYLRRITFRTGYADRITLPQYGSANVVIDPHRGFGIPIFANGAAKVEVVLGRWKSGEEPESLCEEFGVPLHELYDAIRVHTDTAA